MIDFKEWKKIGEDKHGVEMQHSKGHSMKILFKGVPMVQREALKRLPLYDGGDVKGVHKSAMEVDKPAANSKYPKEDKKWAGESKAGEHLQREDIRPGSKEKAKDEHRRVLGEIQTINPKLKGLAEGGDVSSDTDASSQPPVTVNVNTPTTPPPEASTNAQSAQPVNVNAPTVSTSGAAPLLPNGSMNAPATAQLAQQSATEQANIDAAKAQALVPLEQAKLTAQVTQAQRDNDNINMLKQHADAMAANLKDIDPNHIFKQMSAPAKVSTALGMFLGGFSTPFGGQNFTGDFLNKQIDRDIQAQQTNNQKQKTIFDTYRTLYGDQNTASSMAKASMADIYGSQANVIAQKLGTPQAFANLHKVQSDLGTIKNDAIIKAGGNLRSLPNNPTSIQQPTAPPQAQPSPTNNQPQQSEGWQGSYINSLTGSPSANASVSPSSALAPDEYADTPLLKPNAQDILDELRYAPKAKDEIKDIEGQYTKAQQADMLLGQLHPIMSQLARDTQESGASGYLRRHDPSAAIPVVGHALSEAFISPATDTAVNRRIQSNQTRIIGDIVNALKGTPVGVEEVRKAVEDNTPEHNDTPETLALKERNIRAFIKNSIDKSLLKDWKLMR